MKKTTKRQYRIRNWKEYNTALVRRGSLTVWLDEAVLKDWINQEKTGRRGASPTYTDTAIECALSLGAVYQLPLRQTEGLLASVLELLDVELAAPDYSTLCRRRSRLPVVLVRQTRGEPVHLVVDSTGVKVYGEGEWKVRQHGWSKRRTWRKLHLGVDEASGEILAAVASTNDISDGEVLPALLEQIAEPIEQVSGDGSYDKRNCYQAIAQRQARAVIPPRRDAHIWQHGNCAAEPVPRDENLRRIRQVGRRAWKQESGYHRRSLAETTIFRIKTIFGDKLGARQFAAQAVELFIRCAVLNRMTHLGMPDSYAM